MKLLALDPGNVKTGFVLYESTPDAERVLESGEPFNEDLLLRLRSGMDATLRDAELVIELIDQGGQASRTLFQSCIWSGRFAEAWEQSVGVLCRGGPAHRARAHWVTRSEAKNHLTRKPQSGDKEVRAALIQRFGPQGTKRNPGPLCGVTGHKLAALCVAVAYADQQALKASIWRSA